MVEKDVDHARSFARRVVRIDDAGREVVIMESDGGHRIGALAIPEAEHRRAVAQDAVPVRRALLRLAIVEIPVLPVEATSLVGIQSAVAHALDDVARLLGQDVGRIIGLNDLERAGTVREEDADSHRNQDTGQQGHGDAYAQACTLACRGDHLRRWRLPRGQRGGQRIASRKGGGHRESRCRAGRGIHFQAAQDHAFDRRIHVANQRGGGQRRSAGSHAYQIGQRRGLKGRLAGEELI